MKPVTLIDEIIESKPLIHAGSFDFYWQSFGFDLDDNQFAIYQCAECLEEIKDEVEHLAIRLISHIHPHPHPLDPPEPLRAP